MKPKTNTPARSGQKKDRCQTPFYAVDPLLSYLPHPGTVKIWEPACGQGNISAKLKAHGYSVVSTDILYGQDFFVYRPETWLDTETGLATQIIVTNPPYSIKYDWLARCYALKRPFALLLPIDTLGSARAQKMFDELGVEIILLDKRVNFEMPDPPKDGKSQAQYSTAWFTWGLGIGSQLVFENIFRYENDQLPLFVDAEPSWRQDALFEVAS